jgi:hypothetical protein
MRPEIALRPSTNGNELLIICWFELIRTPTRGRTEMAKAAAKKKAKKPASRKATAKKGMKR